MHCVGDKTYDKPDECPKCGMNIVTKKMNMKTEIKKVKNEPENKGDCKKHKH